MMKPYPSYKDSGIEWIGEIPGNWEVKKLKYTSDISPSNVDKHIYPEEIQIRLCNYTNVYYNEFITPSLEFKKGSCNQNEFDKFRLRQGDVIITKDSETPDDIGIPTLSTEDFDNVVCGYHLTLIRPKEIVGRYLFRFIQSDRIRKYFEINSDGVTRFGLGKPTIENMYIPLPPTLAQEHIVSYLDEQTQKIDELIEKTEKKIELLKEKRISLINHCVTKGLNPNVEMKDSGIEWIGEIPVIWEAIKIKYIVEINGLIRGPFGSSLKIDSFVTSGYKVYEQKNAIYKNKNLGEYYISKTKYSDLKRFTIKRNDFIMSCSGTIGKAYLFSDDYEEGIINQALLIIRFNRAKGVYHNYMSYVIDSWGFQKQIIDNSRGGAMMNLVGIDIFKNIKVPFPSFLEQQQIVEYLNEQTQKIDSTIEKESQRIELLKEYRQSLISEVVTGKIDVREEVAI